MDCSLDPAVQALIRMEYFWVCLPDRTTGEPAGPVRFDSLKGAVEHWVAWMGTHGQDVLNREEIAMRKISMIDVARPPHWNVRSLKDECLTSFFYTTAESDTRDMFFDEEDYTWKVPGVPVPDSRVLQAAGELPGAVERLRLLQQQLDLIERIAAVQEDEWFTNQAAAAKIRWYDQRGEQGPAVPAFSYDRLRAEDMRCTGPLTPTPR